MTTDSLIAKLEKIRDDLALTDHGWHEAIDWAVNTIQNHTTAPDVVKRVTQAIAEVFDQAERKPHAFVATPKRLAKAAIVAMGGDADRKSAAGKSRPAPPASDYIRPQLGGELPYTREVGTELPFSKASDCQSEVSDADGWFIPLSSMSSLSRDTFRKMMRIIEHGGQVDVVARVDATEYRWECDGLKYAELRTTEPNVIDKALANAAEILANFKGERNRAKIEEWQACYAMLFKQMNDLVESTRPVAVSLEKLADALFQSVYEMPMTKKNCTKVGAWPSIYKQHVKAVLDAAQVKYAS